MKEGFGQHDLHPDVDTGVRKAAEVFETLGCEVKEVSIPWHAFGVSIWAAIALEGTYQSMFNGASLGGNVEGVYPASLAGMAGANPRARQRTSAHSEGGDVTGGL